MSSFKCEGCKFIAESKTSLSRHKEICRALFMPCEHCNKSYNQRYLIEHRLRCQNIQDFRCDICCYTASSSAEVKRHKLIHSGVKFSCDVCQKEFHAVLNLKEHLKRTHSANRYSCSICEMAFKTKPALTSHQNGKHTTETPFQCSSCSFACKTKRDLASHVLNFHSTKTFSY